MVHILFFLIGFNQVLFILSPAFYYLFYLILMIYWGIFIFDYRIDFSIWFIVSLYGIIYYKILLNISKFLKACIRAIEKCTYKWIQVSNSGPMLRWIWRPKPFIWAKHLRSTTRLNKLVKDWIALRSNKSPIQILLI